MADFVVIKELTDPRFVYLGAALHEESSSLTPLIPSREDYDDEFTRITEMEEVQSI